MTLLIKILLLPIMFNNFFATYNIVDPPPQPAKTQEYVEEPMPFNDYYKQFIPQIIQQQQEIPNDIVPPDSDPVGLPEPGSLQLDIPNEVPTEQPDISQNIIDTARQFLGWKYISGGTTPKSGGFDCSGLLSYVYKQNGIDIGRSTHDIFRAGTEVSNLYDVRPGDIICTPGSGRTGKHVKMVSRVEDGQIYVIEAKGKKWGIIEHPLTKISNITTIRRILGNQTPTSTPTTTSGKFNTHREFVQTLNQQYQEALRNKGLDPNYSYILVAQDANESGWGTALAGNFNYGGIKSKTGPKKKTFEYINGVKTTVYDSFRNFTSIQDYCNYKISLLSNDNYRAFSTIASSEPSRFLRHINDHGYSTSPSSTYVPYIMGIYKTVKRLS